MTHGRDGLRPFRCYACSNRFFAAPDQSSPRPSRAVPHTRKLGRKFWKRMARRIALGVFVFGCMYFAFLVLMSMAGAG